MPTLEVLILKYGCEANNLMAKKANKVMPLLIVVDKTCSIDIELEYSLEFSINIFEKVSVSLNFSHIKSPNLWIIGS